VEHCRALDDARSKLAAAVRFESLELQRSGWAVKVEATPAAADPQIENVSTLMAALGLTTDNHSMRAILNLLYVAVLELIAIFMPSLIFAYKQGSRQGNQGQPDTLIVNPPATIQPETLQEATEPQKALLTATETNPPAIPPNPPEPLEIAEKPPHSGEFDLRRWAEENITLRQGSGLQSKPLYEVYVVWAGKRNIEPVTIAIFGRLMPQIGFAKMKDKKSGLMVYQNVALKACGLKVVK
jgi:hypothetical protein